MGPTVAVVVEHGWHTVPGGTAVAVDATIRAIVEQGAIRLSGIAAAHRRQPASVLPISVRHAPLPRPLLYECWHRLGMPRSGASADVIWAPAMAVPPRSTPLVVTVHDVDFLEHPERLSRRGASFFPKAWSVAVERADRIAVPSEVVAGKVVTHGVDRERLEVIPWGVDQDVVDASAARSVARRLGLPDRFVLWVGTAEPRKNLAGLVEAMGSPTLADVPLVIAGPEGWGLDRDATLAPLGKRAMILGHLDRADLLAVYALATVFAYPSFDEGFGLPVLEAMVQGTPVVTSATTATAEVAGGAASLVDPLDTDALASAIEGLLSDRELHASTSVAGRRRAVEMTWGRTAERYVDVFEQLAESNR